MCVCSLSVFVYSNTKESIYKVRRQKLEVDNAEAAVNALHGQEAIDALQRCGFSNFQHATYAKEMLQWIEGCGQEWNKNGIAPGMVEIDTARIKEIREDVRSR